MFFVFFCNFSCRFFFCNFSCGQKSIIYQADISHGNVTESYIACSETEFKSRYYNHIQSFKNIKKRNATELSKTF